MLPARRLLATALVPAPANPSAASGRVGASAVRPSARSWAKAARARAKAQTRSSAAAAPTQTGSLVLAPGQTGRITVVITPSAASKGKVIAGTLFVDTVDLYQGTGDEVLAAPYRYTVG